MLYLVLFLVVAALAGVVAALITADSLWAWVSIGISVLALILLVIDWIRRRPSRTGTAGGVEPEEVAEEGETPEDTETTEHVMVEAAAEYETVAEGGSEAEQSTVVLETAEPSGDEHEPVDVEAETTETTEAPETTEALAVDSSATAVRTEDVPAEREQAEEDGGTEVESGEQVTVPSAPESPAENMGGTAAGGAVSESRPAGSKSAGGPESAERPPGEEDTDAADLLVVAELDAEVLVVDEYPRYHLKGCGWLSDRDTIPIAVSEARDLGFTPCARCGPDSALASKHRKKRGRFRSRAGRGTSRDSG